MVPSTTSVCYVYGIVPAALDASSAPAGVDDSRVELETYDGVAALVSFIDGDEYSPSLLERSTGDVEWMSPRAVAHDRVLTWASDRGAVVPLPMFSLFTGPSAVQAMLRERSSQLADTLGSVARGREYALRVYRIDAELLDAITSLRPGLAALAAQAAAATPGQRYLLERKLDAEKRGELSGVSRDVGKEIVDALGAESVETATSPIPRVADSSSARGTMVLNAAFLVAPERLSAFQKALTSLVERHGGHGFRFDFTGPWPPYHFSGGTIATHDA